MSDAIARLLSEVIVSAHSFAVLAIMCAGLLLMVRQRAWSARLLALACLFIVVGQFGPLWLPH